MYDVTRYWLQDMGVDGFRLDAIKHLIEDGQTQQDTPETHAWIRDFRKFYTSIKPDAFTIGEVNGPSNELSGYYPDQLDEYFEFGLAQSLVQSARNGQASFVNLVQDANNHWPLQRYGIFLTNHDQTRVASTLNGDMAKLKIAATAYLTITGLPFIYYGEEIGMQGAKPDERIRTPMQWTSDPNGGFTTGKPWEPLNKDLATVNVQSEASDPNSLLNLYRQLIHLRRSHPALSQGDLLPLDSSDFSVGAYLRHTANEDVLVVLNMGNSEVKDLQLSLSASALKAGTYTPEVLFSVDNNTAIKIAPLTVDDKGTINNYTPLASLPAYSGYVLLLKK
jgi:glycosidase